MPDSIGTLIVAAIFGPPLLYLAIGIPLILLDAALGAALRWKRTDLQTKSRFRAGAAAFVLVGLAIYTVKRGGFSSMPELELWCVASGAAFATLWLGAGIAGSQGSLRYDPMSLFWYGLVGLAAIALLFVEGWPF